MKLSLSKLLIISLVAVFSLVSTKFALAIDCSTCSNQSGLSTKQAVECGTNCASGSNQTPAQATSNVNQTIITVVNLLTAAVGVVAVIMIIVGGLRYITSGGKQESVGAAKNTILYAVIGLVIVAMAQVIARFVLTKIT